MEERREGVSSLRTSSGSGGRVEGLEDRRHGPLLDDRGRSRKSRRSDDGDGVHSWLVSVFMWAWWWEGGGEGDVKAGVECGDPCGVCLVGRRKHFCGGRKTQKRQLCMRDSGLAQVRENLRLSIINRHTTA